MIKISLPAEGVPSEIRAILESMIATLQKGQTDPDEDGNIVAICSYLNQILIDDKKSCKSVFFFEVGNQHQIRAHVLGEDCSVTFVPLAIAG